MTPPHRKADKRGWLVGVVSLVIVGAIFIVIYALPTITLMNAISGDKISQEDRYYHINQLLEEIDYRNVGTIVHETPYDKVTRSLSPVHFEATFQDPQSFNILKTRILAAVEVECGYSDISLVCRQGRPSVSLSLEKDNTVKLTLNDSGTGR